MPTVDEYPGNSVFDVVIFFAQQACLFVDKLENKFLNLLLVWVGRILSLFEEVCGRVLQWLHTQCLNIISENSNVEVSVIKGTSPAQQGWLDK